MQILGGVCGFRHGIEESEKMLHPSDLKCAVHSITNSNKCQCPSILLMSDVGAHQRTDAGRVHIRNVREVYDEGAGIVRAHLGLKVEQRRDQQRTAKAQNTLPMLWTG